MILDLNAPHTTYRDKDGKRLTGVTTYLSALAKPQLFKWYADEERKGVLACAASGDPLPSKPFAEAKRDKAADLGTVTHAQVEAWLDGDVLEEDGIPQDIFRQSFNGLERFKAWWHDSDFQIIDSERVMVVSEPNETGMAFGGTADIIARDCDGKTVLIDLKTTKKSRYWPYPETYGQVAAYAFLCEWADNGGGPINIDRIIIARIGKEVDDELEYVEVTPAQRRAGWDLFTAAYNAHESKKLLERLANDYNN